MAINIAINADYRIKSDNLNVIVERRYTVDPTKSPNWPKMEAKGADPTPRDKWREASYHTTVDKALEWVADQQIRECNAETLRDLAREIGRVYGEIKAIARAE